MTNHVSLDEMDFGVFFPEQGVIVSLQNEAAAEAAISEARSAAITTIRLYVKKES
jgi:hypothetical protein